MPWASADAGAGVGKAGLVVGSPATDVEVTGTGYHSWGAC